MQAVLARSGSRRRRVSSGNGAYQSASGAARQPPERAKAAREGLSFGRKSANLSVGVRTRTEIGWRSIFKIDAAESADGLGGLSWR